MFVSLGFAPIRSRERSTETLLFLLVLTGLAFNGSCARNPAKEFPAPGVTRNLPARPAGVIQHIDAIGPVANPDGKIVSAFAARVLKVTGWAVDSDNRLPASHVDVVIDGIAYAAKYGIGRPDVAAYLKDSAYMPCGFEFSMPARGLTKGRHAIVVRVVASDGTWFVPAPEIIVELG